MTGLHDDYLPDWLNDFAIAEKLRVSVLDLPGVPARWIYRAKTLIAAERHMQNART